MGDEHYRLMVVSETGKQADPDPDDLVAHLFTMSREDRDRVVLDASQLRPPPRSPEERAARVREGMEALRAFRADPEAQAWMARALDEHEAERREAEQEGAVMWEYTTIEALPLTDSDLNRMGRDGWELVAVRYAEHARFSFGDIMAATFKRPSGRVPRG